MKYYNIYKDILATFTYFNLFEYPLLKNEVFNYLAHCDDYHEFELALNNLVNDGWVFKIGNFYSIQDDCTVAVKRREGNRKAIPMLKKAKRIAKIISSFPFVKGVALSGSLSKYYADKDSDIDFFIITVANRLWIARSFLHALKKISFLFNMQQLFCMNYFIDEAELVILEKNIYTAIEVATIIPLDETEIFLRFFKANRWIDTFIPNKRICLPPNRKTKKSRLVHLIEKLFDNKHGNTFDDYLMKLTSKRWDLKSSLNKKNIKGLLLSLHTGKHFSKPGPDIFQKKLLDRYEICLAEVFKKYECPRSRILNA